MIEQLHEHTICDKYDNAYGVHAPSNWELMWKRKI